MNQGISVIIPSYNGARKISNVLQALEKQTLKADEIILVLDGSADNSKEVAVQFSSRLPLRIFEIPNKGRAGARNTGVANAKFELIVFFDDDMRPFPECLREHAKLHEQVPNALLGGSIQEDASLFTTDIQQYRIKLYERKGWIRSEEAMKPMKDDEVFLAAANMSLTRETFYKLSGFDERLRDIEDFDLCNRAVSMGMSIYYNQGYADAYHDDPITCKSYILRQREYMKSLHQLYRMKPDIYEKYLHRIHPKPSRPKRILYSLISNGFMVSLIDQGVMKYLMPAKVRYPFYDYIINGLIQVYPVRYIG